MPISWTRKPGAIPRRKSSLQDWLTSTTRTGSPRKMLARTWNSFARISDLNADIVDAETGCNTPAEEFITGLVDQHYSDGLTPEDVSQDMEQFRENFDSMVRDAKRIVARYPEAFNPAA